MAYTSLPSSNPAFSNMRTAFNKSGAASINTYSTSYRVNSVTSNYTINRLSASNLSMNSYYRNQGYWYIEIYNPFNHQRAPYYGWNLGISSVTFKLNGYTVASISSGGTYGSNTLAYNSSTAGTVIVVPANTYSTYSIDATVDYGYTWYGWANSSNSIITYTKSTTLTASSYTVIRPWCYG